MNDCGARSRRSFVCNRKEGHKNVHRDKAGRTWSDNGPRHSGTGKHRPDKPERLRSMPLGRTLMLVLGMMAVMALMSVAVVLSLLSASRSGTDVLAHPERMLDPITAQQPGLPPGEEIGAATRTEEAKTRRVGATSVALPEQAPRPSPTSNMPLPQPQPTTPTTTTSPPLVDVDVTVSPPPVIVIGGDPGEEPDDGRDPTTPPPPPPPTPDPTAPDPEGGDEESPPPVCPLPVTP